MLDSDQETQTIPSPCIRRCCLDDNDICVGCKRTLDEILAWSSANDLERQAILERCKARTIK